MRRQTIFVVAAGAAALVAALVVYSALRKREAQVQQAMLKTVNIVVAAHDLPLGTKIGPQDVKLARWSRDSVPTGAYTDTHAVLNSFVKNEFIKNEPIVPDKLFLGQKTAGVMPLLIPVGMRAMSVQVDQVSDIAGFVLPHTHVDVLVAITNQGGANEKPFSKIVLQNVQVLAVAQEIEHTKDKPKVVKVVTLLVTPEQAERLALAEREGTLHLAMRNYSDNKIVETTAVNINNLLGSPSGPSLVRTQTHFHHVAPRPRPVEVQVMRDGKDTESIAFVRKRSSVASDPYWLVHGVRNSKKTPGAPRISSVAPSSYVAPPAAAVASNPGGGKATFAAAMGSSVKSGGAASPVTAGSPHAAETAFNSPSSKTIDVP